MSEKVKNLQARTWPETRSKFSFIRPGAVPSLYSFRVWPGTGLSFPLLTRTVPGFYFRADISLRTISIFIVFTVFLCPGFEATVPLFFLYFLATCPVPLFVTVDPVTVVLSHTNSACIFIR